MTIIEKIIEFVKYQTNVDITPHINARTTRRKQLGFYLDNMSKVDKRQVKYVFNINNNNKYELHYNGGEGYVIKTKKNGLK